jgi:hypothetical protein
LILFGAKLDKRKAVFRVVRKYFEKIKIISKNGTDLKGLIFKNSNLARIDP